MDQRGSRKIAPLQITSNFYSILFYNAEIWLLPGLNKILRTNLLSSSANALKICIPYYDYTMSFYFLHTINERATPHKFMLYKHAIELHKLFNLSLFLIGGRTIKGPH